MRLLILGDPVVTLDAATPYIERGAVVVQDEVIVDVGHQSQFPARDGFDAVLGSDEQLVMPGLFNCHFHSDIAYGHGIYDSVWETANLWFHENMGPAEEEDLYYILL